MRHVRPALAVACAVVLVACRGPAGPTTPLNRQFVLAPGEAVRIAETTVTVRFVEVLGDSRCPADAVCILGGDAIVRIDVQSGTGSGEPRDLHTADPAPVTFMGLRIMLVDLAPYPFSAMPIAPGDYRATLLVTR